MHINFNYIYLLIIVIFIYFSYYVLYIYNYNSVPIVNVLLDLLQSMINAVNEKKRVKFLIGTD